MNHRKFPITGAHKTPNAPAPDRGKGDIGGGEGCTQSDVLTSLMAALFMDIPYQVYLIYRLEISNILG